MSTNKTKEEKKKGGPVVELELGRDLGPYDVLFGRGNGVAESEGNVNFRVVVWEHKEAYLKAQRFDKGSIAEDVIDKIQSMGGRFVERRGTDSYGNERYILVPDHKVHDKTSQALREKKMKMPKGFQSKAKAAIKKQSKKKKPTNQKKKTVPKPKPTKKPDPRATKRYATKNSRSGLLMIPGKQSHFAKPPPVLQKEAVETSLYPTTQQVYRTPSATSAAWIQPPPQAQISAKPFPGYFDAMFNRLPPPLTAFVSGMFSGKVEVADTQWASGKVLPASKQNNVNVPKYGAPSISPIPSVDSSDDRHGTYESPTSVRDVPQFVAAAPPLDSNQSLLFDEDDTVDMEDLKAFDPVAAWNEFAIHKK